jgi:hypothetical protein
VQILNQGTHEAQKRAIHENWITLKEKPRLVDLLWGSRRPACEHSVRRVLFIAHEVGVCVESDTGA